MPYPEQMVQPMREELTRLGVKELKTAEEVDQAFDETKDGTMVLVINSVCGCAAGNARPAVAMVKQGDTHPDAYTTVFAGQDLEATDRAREHLAGIPPSSPFIALFRNGDPVYVIQRKHIEGRTANAIASDLRNAIDTYCTDGDIPADAPSQPNESGRAQSDNVPSSFRSIM
ncbi:hypothetical protein CRI94_01465 [Longibacter salinarum]|uniref:BrxA/BrxB family bacilliredoxin n=1 Tax=Longibacter salinarum TaxID=1850348 RepID=A0A2A8D2E3_9BACT|nr:BrxA/BrxB family bacilliredoxin [Longibacter salinarum]PEN14987.1 hypothetical protein CRI94_01465 [Longibacter salinarum]